MTGLPAGTMIEIAVVVLLAITIGYCIMLNHRLKHLRADRGELQKTIQDLMRATEMANSAIKELKASAQDAETILSVRLSEAERFGIEIANHVNAGQAILDRLGLLTKLARNSQLVSEGPESATVRTALAKLTEHESATRGELRKGAAA